MKRRIITSLSLNGSGIIHDFELAFSGKTSEDADKEIPSGPRFFSQRPRSRAGLGGPDKTDQPGVLFDHPRHRLRLQKSQRYIDTPFFCRLHVYDYIRLLELGGR